MSKRARSQPSGANAHRSNAGNIMIYILGAIVLLGLLYAILRGSFQEGTGIDAENVALKVSQIRAHAADLERGVAFILRNEYGETDLRFAHPDSTVNYGVITDIPARQVFDETGGGVEYKNPPAGINDGTQWQFFATTHLTNVGTDTAAQSRAELLAVLPNVTRAFCDAMNRQVKQTVNLDNPTDPSANGCVYAPGSEFTAGSYGYGAGNNTLDNGEISQLPARELCVNCQTGGYHYYRVLLAR